MLRFMCKSKIHRVKVTSAQLFYEGSISIDEALLKAADILPGEKVEVLNLNNGSRIETYAIVSPAGSGEICLNGPAARSGCVGDELIILAYAAVEEAAAQKLRMKVVYVQSDNKIKDQGLR